MSLAVDSLGVGTLGVESSSSPYIQQSIASFWAVDSETIKRSISAIWNVNQSLNNNIHAPWGVFTATESIVLSSWSVRIQTQQSINALWLIALSQTTKLLWSAAVIEQTVVAPWQALEPIDVTVIALWANTIDVEQTVISQWAILDHNVVEQNVVAQWSMPAAQSAVTFTHDVVLEKDGQVLEIDSASLSGNENSWGWTLNCSFTNLTTWDALNGEYGEGINIKLSFRGQVFNFLIDGVPEKTKRFGKTTYTIKARSNTVQLTTPYADQITQEYTATTAKTIAQSLCDAVSITLDWQTVDWPLSDRLFSVKEQYPLQIIQKLAKAVGAVVQSSKDGSTLIVRPIYPVSPTQYSQSTPAFILTEQSDINSVGEKNEHRQGFDSIEISNQRTDAKTRYSISSEDNGRTLKVTSIPFQDVIIMDSAEGNISIYHQGIFTEALDEEAVIIEGKGRLSQPYYGTLSLSWLYADLGALTIEENGDLSTAINGQSIAKIKYTTQYHQFQVTPVNGVEKAQVYINES